ncbi:MAG TPA: LuxR C-terminal-related transcriptional regulator [Nitrospira sp.]|nr:LuxR C-terminal-related transcriptional regulator [Nitrospira sp.]
MVSLHDRSAPSHGVSTRYDSTGVILLNCMGQLLFMNKEAQLYIRQLQPLGIQNAGGCLIPPDVHSVARDLISRLLECEHPKDCETIQVERLFFSSGQGLLLRGFCIPDDPIASKSRVLLTIEKLHQKLGCPDTNIQYRYHLTQREQMVIIYLMLGFTNKEIANRLNLSEYTVKEHLKRIMQKTKTTTRTGLLARMVFPISGDGSRMFAHSEGVNEPILPPVLKPKMAGAMS